MIVQEAADQAARLYPNSATFGRAYYDGAIHGFRGDSARDVPYREAGGLGKAWLAGFAWAREVNSVMIG